MGANYLSGDHAGYALVVVLPAASARARAAAHLQGGYIGGTVEAGVHHVPHVDGDAALRQDQPGKLVPRASSRHLQPVRRAELDRLHHVFGHIGRHDESAQEPQPAVTILGLQG